MVSMKEIATICKVSVGTVSKALAGQPGVGEKTGQRIREVAARFNYRPNALVRGMQTGRTQMVAVACNAVEDPWGSLVLRGALTTLHEFGYAPLLLQWDLEVQSGEHLLRSMGERRVDGVLMFPPAELPSPEYLQELRTFPGPVVLLDQRWPGNEFNFIGTDDRSGARAAMEHLLELGHSAIGCLHAPKVSTGRVRMQGFIEGLGRAGARLRDDWLAVADTYDTGVAAARTVLQQRLRPSALFCFNDVVAWGALNAAHDLGLKVPEDLSIVGFADLPLAAQLRPRLTTVRQPKEELGRRGVELLLQRIASGDEQGQPVVPFEELLSVELVARDSTGPAPKTR